MPRGMPRAGFTRGFTYTGIAPFTTSALIAERWTLRGIMTFCPACTDAKIIVCTAAVVPFTMKNAWSAPNASAASACASRMTETGCARLSRGFIELTSSDISFAPK